MTDNVTVRLPDGTTIEGPPGAAAEAVTRLKKGKPPPPVASHQPNDKRTGQGRTTLRVRSQIEREPGLTIKELGTRLGMSSNYFYRVVPKLEDEGKVYRDDEGRCYPRIQPAVLPPSLTRETPSPAAQPPLQESEEEEEQEEQQTRRRPRKTGRVPAAATQKWLDEHLGCTFHRRGKKRYTLLAWVTGRDGTIHKPFGGTKVVTEDETRTIKVLSASVVMKDMHQDPQVERLTSAVIISKLADPRPWPHTWDELISWSEHLEVATNGRPR